MVQMEWGHVKILLTGLPPPLTQSLNQSLKLFNNHRVMIDKDRKRAAGADLGFISKGF